MNLFLKRFNEIYQKEHTLSKQTIDLLQVYDWPGNIRELENLIERLVITVRSDEITIDDIPEDLANKRQQHLPFPSTLEKPLPEMVEHLESILIQQAYQQHKTTRKMAKALGITQSSLLRRIQKYNLDLKAEDE